MLDVVGPVMGWSMFLYKFDEVKLVAKWLATPISLFFCKSLTRSVIG